MVAADYANGLGEPRNREVVLHDPPMSAASSRHSSASSESQSDGARWTVGSFTGTIKRLETTLGPLAAQLLKAAAIRRALESAGDLRPGER